jgi:hypothetical protein
METTWPRRVEEWKYSWYPNFGFFGLQRHACSPHTEHAANGARAGEARRGPVEGRRGPVEGPSTRAVLGSCSKTHHFVA